MKCLAAVVVLAGVAMGQEAEAGFELRTTWSAMAGYSSELREAPRQGSAWNAGTRGMFYPTWKISSHWSFSGAVQVVTRPYFYEDFSTQGRGIGADILRAQLTYSQFWEGKSLTVRVGQMPAAFGSFLLRYDDAVNPLIDSPISYGYYGRGVTSLGLMGAQVDATVGKVDVRAQLANSSVLNRRSITDSDQYANWTAGAGYTIVQGTRVGVSAFRGPYLHRGAPFFLPNEAPPRELPATGIGVDAQWARGAWSVYGEWQHFNLPYRAIPDFQMTMGYVEARRVLHPRWFVATRAGYRASPVLPTMSVYEVAAGFRPNARQIVKFGYEFERGEGVRTARDSAYSIQLVTTLPAISLARD